MLTVEYLKNNVSKDDLWIYMEFLKDDISELKLRLRNLQDKNAIPRDDVAIALTKQKLFRKQAELTKFQTAYEGS